MLVYNIRKAANSGFEELYDLKILYGYTCKLPYLPFVCGHWSHTKDFKAVCKAKAVSSFTPTAWVLVWNRGLSQRAPRSAVKPSTRLLNNQIHKAKWKLDTTLHKTVLLSEAKIETITNLMTSAIFPLSLVEVLKRWSIMTDKYKFCHSIFRQGINGHASCFFF